ncbi:MAG TPA: PLP-dependent aspartate aminotransferase family protein [Candidatus Acidoferrales bacterium]|nr:PLP-dependent aspartate aminotransferase family protein [Candidatus Acidoferrales bacterium]
MGFSTDAIHVGQEPDPLTGAVVAPIYQTSTYVLESLDKTKGYVYARTKHPNRIALERTVAKLEGGRAAYAFTSGMAAIDAVFRLLRPGDHTILPRSIYGGTFRLVSKLLVVSGLEFNYVDTSCLEQVEKAIKPSTRMIYVETPSNPTMVVTDIAAVAELARKRNLTLVVDNTFLSPYLQQPIALGAHIVVHSMTKYLNGHSDCIAGAVILARQEDADKIYFIQLSAGAGLAPMDCFLVSRGIKTLAVRMERHNSNGMAIAKFLESHPKVKRVLYTGLASHPQHELAKRQQQRGFGAMMTFDLGSLDAARKFLNRVRLCSLAESLGGVETLISHPASMTHSSMPAEVRKENGITDGMVRLSVGIEDVEDLVADIDQALAVV